MMETYHGQIRSPMDAIILFEACRIGLLPRVQRRLSEKERQSIKSGSIFVWDEREAGMRRWTDGKSWSASRVSGSFLTYREMEGKRGGATGFSAPTPIGRTGKSPDNGSDSDSDNRMEEDGPDGYRYKPDGLVKQSFSITTSSNQKLHLISYFSRSDPDAGRLMQPSADPNFKNIFPIPGMYPEQTLQEQTPVPPPTTQRGMLPAPFQGSQISPQSQLLQGERHPADHHQPHIGSHSHLQGYGTGQPQLPTPYAWPPSPISTPTNFAPGAPYPTSLSPPLLSQTSPNMGAQNGSYDPNIPPSSLSYPSLGSPTHYEPLQPLQPHVPHRPSVTSAMSHLQPTQSSPRLPNFHHNPLPLLPPEGPRYSSPSTSATGTYVTRSSPRPSDPWEPPSFKIEKSSGSPVNGSLDVQDIPNEKISFGEDMRALRQLDKASFTGFTIR